MNIVISPFSKKLRERDTPHPKNYPFWKDLVSILSKDHKLIQIGAGNEEKLVKKYFFNLSFSKLSTLVKGTDLFISVDNFFPHFCHYEFKGSKKGIVIFAKSDPEIFGYQENMNLLKDKKYLRWDQFGPWEATDYIEEAFVLPEQVVRSVEIFGKLLEK